MSALDFYERNRKFLEAREQKLEKIREETRQKEELELSEQMQKATTPFKTHPAEKIEDRLLAHKKNQAKKLEPQRKFDNQADLSQSGLRARGRFKSSSNLKNDLLLDKKLPKSSGALIL